MKNTPMIAAALATCTFVAANPAKADWTPGRLACIRAAGYTSSDWDNHTVPAGAAAKYRACRAQADAREGSNRRQGRNDSPQAQACMAKNGFNQQMWLAHSAGTDEQVLRYIQCRDRVPASKALETGRRDHNFSPNF